MQASIVLTAKSMLYAMEKQGDKTDKVLMETKQGKRGKM